jgi:hypothetical protein
MTRKTILSAFLLSLVGSVSAGNVALHWSPAQPAPGGGETATWGDTNQYTSDPNCDGDWAYVGGVSPSGSGNTLESVTVYTGVTTTARLALYVGGSASSPVGATILEDLGTQASSGVQSVVFPSSTNPTLPNASQIWLAYKSSNAGCPRVGNYANHPYDVDYLGIRVMDNSTTAWETTVSSFTPTPVEYEPAIYITYSY